MTAPQFSNGVRVAFSLRELRTRLGISQKDLATDVGTTRQTVSRWETGKEPLSAEQINNLCLALRCTTEQLFDVGDDVEDHLTRDSVLFRHNIPYGTLKLRTAAGIRKYPIDEQTRVDILFQINSLPTGRDNSRWLYCFSLDNKIVLVNPKCIQSIELIGDDVQPTPQYYSQEVYGALDDLEVTELSEKLKNECEIIVAKISEEEAARMVSFVRVTYLNGEDEWNFLDSGSAGTFFGLEAKAFKVPQSTFAEIEEEGYYRARYANLDHVAIMEVPSDRYRKLTRNRPSVHQRRAMPLSARFQAKMSTQSTGAARED
ncbi:hypothetical protein CK215_25940 [Mesorhizobium sp. WSM3864]|uniref:helix-turn-helix transcriptional regulator n=1 Tax=Mesorhizobium sp. WSM3864 TaxID=2029404 RepID=UPI000BB09315|nr:helix-turn-helix transcriptional regulator [Mesorhizobium sp. WSM3864]PBB89731.1 hypothetical protein CK215_25940 [Mesorhizobium sp. WSM3864]